MESNLSTSDVQLYSAGLKSNDLKTGKTQNLDVWKIGFQNVWFSKSIARALAIAMVPTIKK